ncbi:hypothetical protein CCR75_008522 [Bremia lactucae]|uniref:Uncharacterized protein n=1 Tax=Bremia lactucae TaxID=4779 RepID=A0A976FHS5_BRELC|nr:hypothetical protein CCR75_008522 [Bremia lactucae]
MSKSSVIAKGFDTTYAIAEINDQRLEARPHKAPGQTICVLQDVSAHGLARKLVSVAAASHNGMTVEYMGTHASFGRGPI